MGDVHFNKSSGLEPELHRNSPGRLPGRFSKLIHGRQNPLDPFHQDIINLPSLQFRKSRFLSQREKHLAGCLSPKAWPETMVQIMGRNLRIHGRGMILGAWEVGNQLLPQTRLQLPLRLLDRPIIGRIIHRAVQRQHKELRKNSIHRSMIQIAPVISLQKQGWTKPAKPLAQIPQKGQVLKYKYFSARAALWRGR